MATPSAEAKRFNLKQYYKEHKSQFVGAELAVFGFLAAVGIASTNIPDIFRVTIVLRGSVSGAYGILRAGNQIPPRSK